MVAAMDDDAAIRLRRVISKLARELNASSTGAGLTPSEASVLGLIVARGPVGLGELSELEGLNPTMLSRVIGKLHSMSLIDRIRDPADLRNVSAVSTPAGRRADKRVKALKAAAVSQCMALLPAEQAAAVAAALPALEELTVIMRSARPAAGRRGRGAGREIA
jgi:DNA-binding MarR family transcriptional regulator